jgi:hypothetical protein
MQAFCLRMGSTSSAVGVSSAAMRFAHEPSLLTWRVARWAAALAFLLSLLPLSAAQQQPCNPVIDGTYCATQMPRAGTSTQSRISMSPIQDIGSAISLGSNSPGTLGGISFRSGGTSCIGLLRRGNCS